MMRAMRLSRTMALVVCGFIWLASLGAQAPQNQSRWAKPAAELAAQIADIVGPGQAQLTIRNLSNIPAGELPEIRKLLEQDLKVRGVLISGNESANVIRITLSEDARERLWVAEVIEGNATRVAIVRVDGSSTIPTNPA
jgi:hypothetical protein